MTVVAIVDYGSGNLRSAERALTVTGAEVFVTDDMARADAADGVVLPGVGAFAACMAGIRAVGADELVRTRLAAGRPVLGICVGMQVMYAAGDEHGEHTAGIGVLEGGVARLRASVLPHMGWNTVEAADGSRLFAGIRDDRFYFVHSYAVAATGATGQSTAIHGSTRFVAAVESGALSATQFHPEKSGAVGARLLGNWVSTLS